MNNDFFSFSFRDLEVRILMTASAGCFSAQKSCPKSYDVVTLQRVSRILNFLVIRVYSRKYFLTEHVDILSSRPQRHLMSSGTTQF